MQNKVLRESGNGIVSNKRLTNTKWLKTGIVHQLCWTFSSAVPRLEPINSRPQRERKKNNTMHSEKHVWPKICCQTTPALITSRTSRGNLILLYLYVTQSTAEDAEVGGLLLIHIRNVFLQCLKTLFEVCSPKNRRNQNFDVAVSSLTTPTVSKSIICLRGQTSCCL